jgi:hypothetical protein
MAKGVELGNAIQVLGRHPQRIADIIAPLSAEELRLPPAPGEWSCVELLAHLRCCGDMWGQAISRILSEDHPTFRAVNPRTWARETDYAALQWGKSFEAFAVQREGLVVVLQALPPEGWERSATVTGAGKTLERSVRFYAAWLADHERAHLGQFEKIVGALRGT